MMEIKYRDFENMGDRIKTAYHIAQEKHKGQFDKTGKVYIYHPMSVASLVPEDEACIIVALLHDTVEDTDYTLQEAEEAFGYEIAAALDLVTHKKDEPYMDYVKRAAGNPVSKAVKIADLTHNMDLSRFENPSEKDYLRLEMKYKPAMEYLKSMK